MSVPPDGTASLATLLEKRSPLAAATEQLRILDAVPVRDALGGRFEAHLAGAGLAPLRATGIRVFQLNVGKVCNQTCAHCHVDAGPTRTEQMSRATAELAMRVLASTDIPIVDVTGGAPELNPNFRYLVEESRALGRHVMDRCNVTILATPRGPELVELFVKNRVEVVCSLPHYRELNTDAQRGDGVFARSIEGLKRLNAAGYGREGSGLRLVLVTNPVGAIVPSSSQSALRAEWKRELRRLHGIEFDDLFTITNMPISRFLEWLRASGNLETYLQKLVTAFNPSAAAGVMCRDTISVGWDGRLFDCDFNQMLELEVGHGFDVGEGHDAGEGRRAREGRDAQEGYDAADGRDAHASRGRLPRHLSEFDRALLDTRRIVTARHCFGCTAGAGSSCGGQTT